MSNVNSVGAGSGVAPVANFSAAGMSPDALIAYCQMQLGNINTQLSAQINLQNRQVQEQKAVNTLKAALEQFGTKGPSGAHPEQMTTCVDAFNAAIASLPEGDPLRTELASQRDAMTVKYAYTLPHDTPHLADDGNGNLAPDGTMDHYDLALNKPPEEGQWQGTIEQISSLSTTIASTSQIGMLQISSLASAQQTAMEQAINLLNKRDSTLSDIAKNA